jgi:hypothetical protein
MHPISSSWVAWFCLQKLIDRRLRHRRIDHLLHRPIHSRDTFLCVYILSLYVFENCQSCLENLQVCTIHSIPNSTDETGLYCPQIRVQIARSKFTYTPASYIRAFTTTNSSAKMSNPTPQAPQTPLVGSGTDYSALVQGSTDPTDQSMVIRQVIPGMLTFSVPFVCPSSFLAFISSLIIEPIRRSALWRSIDRYSPYPIYRERDFRLRLVPLVASYQVSYHQAPIRSWRRRGWGRG